MDVVYVAILPRVADKTRTQQLHQIYLAALAVCALVLKSLRHKIIVLKLTKISGSRADCASQLRVGVVVNYVQLLTFQCLAYGEGSDYHKNVCVCFPSQFQWQESRNLAKHFPVMTGSAAQEPFTWCLFLFIIFIQPAIGNSELEVKPTVHAVVSKL